jgi:hypothetical protein
VTVTITAAGYGSFADVVETLPLGFTYMRSSLPADQVTTEGRTVTLSLIGIASPATFTYTVRASSGPDDHDFRGVFSGVDANFDPFDDVRVGGDPILTVQAPAPTTGPRASRSFSADPVDTDAVVTVTITAAGYGSFADVVETLPLGFTYMRSSLPADQVTTEGRTVTLSLIAGPLR